MADWKFEVFENEYLAADATDVHAIVSIECAGAGAAGQAGAAAEVIIVDTSGSMSSPASKIRSARAADQPFSYQWMKPLTRWLLALSPAVPQCLPRHPDEGSPRGGRVAGRITRPAVTRLCYISATSRYYTQRGAGRSADAPGSGSGYPALSWAPGFRAIRVRFGS